MFSINSGLSTKSTADWTGSELFADGSEQPEQALGKGSDQVTAKDLGKQRRNLDKGVDLKQMFVRNNLKLRSSNMSSGT